MKSPCSTPGRAGARDQLRQRGRSLARLFLALGGARHPAQGAEMAVHAPPARCSSGRSRTRAMVRWGLMMLRNCTSAATRATRAGWCRSPNIAATCCASCAPRPASPTMSAARARCSCSAARRCSTAPARTSRFCEQLRRALRAARSSPAASAMSRRWPRAREARRAACACPATRPATASSSPTRSPRSAAERGVEFRYGVQIDAIRAEGGQITGVETSTGRPHRRRLCGGAGQLLAAAAAPHRHRRAGLSGQGLLAHRADHRCRRARPSRPSWTRPTRSRSRGSATASGWAAWRSSTATT